MYLKRRNQLEERITRLCIESLETRLVLTSAQLSIFVDSVRQDIPAEIGVDANGNNLSQVRTVDANGLLDINPIANEPLEDITLGDFFETWRTNAGVATNNADATFSASELLGNTVSGTETVQMFVNGEVNVEYENYVIQEADEIFLVYGENPVVSLNTNFGSLIFELFPSAAPGTVENFLNYVNDGRYIDSFFHRSADRNGDDFVIQGGGFATPSTAFTSTDVFTRVVTDDPIQNEPNQPNVRGTVAMAKTSDPDSATSQFFVNLSDDNTFLDDPNNSGGFTVFGQVLDLTNADAIAALPVREEVSPYNELPVSESGELVVVQSIEGQGTVSGVKFADADSDGNLDSSEQGLGAQTIFSDANGNGLLDDGEVSTTTADDGSYTLLLAPGNHTIATLLSSTDSVATRPTGGTYSVEVEVGRDIPDQDFGEGPESLQLSAADDSVEINNDVTSEVIDVLANDAAPEGTTITAVTQGSAGGTVAIDGDQITYTPSSGFVGQDTFTYTIDDTNGNSDTATVTVDVADPNVNAVSGTVYIDHDGDDVQDENEAGVPGVEITLSGDSDDGDAISLTVLTADDGSYSFDAVPPGTYTLTQTQPEALEDGVSADGDTNEIGDVAVVAGEDVTANNFAEAGIKAEYASILWFLASNGSDQDIFREMVAMAEDDIGNADLAESIRNGRSESGDNGDGDGGGDTPSTNAAPVAVDDSFDVTQDTVLTVAADSGVLANDTDGDGDTLTATVDSDPANGTLTLQSDGGFTYTANDGFSGTDTFTYVTSDGTDSSSAATVTIIVAEVQQGSPIAVADTYSTNEDETLRVVVADGLLANDSDPDGDALTVSIVNTTTNGTLFPSATGSFNYIPTTDFSGTDSFTYSVSDGQLSAEGTATITVVPINDDPVASDDALQTNEDEPLTMNAADGLLANDSDVDGDNLTAAIVDSPSNGVVALNGDGSFTYTPDADFSGADSFTYRIEDGNGGSDDATANITVDSVEDAPVATEDNYTVAEDEVLAIDAVMGLLANDTDGDGDSLTASVATDPERGSVVVESDGSFTYTPNADFFGSDSFRYVANDGSANSEPATVSIEVTSVDDPSTIVIPQEFLDENNPGTRSMGDPISFEISVEDVDDSGYILQLDLEDSGIPESAAMPTIQPATGLFEWTPDSTGLFEIRVIAVNGPEAADQETFFINIV